MAWSIVLNFNDESGDHDITALVLIDTLKRKRALWKDLKPTSNTLSFKMNRSAAMITKLLTNDGDTDVTVTRDGSGWFKGYVRTNFKIESKTTVQPVQIECVDRAEKLKRLIKDTFVYTGYKVCNHTTTASSIVHQLLIKAGFELGDINISTTIDKTIDYFVNVPAHKEQTYWDALTAILFEFGHVWYWDEDGKFNIYEFLPTDTSTANAFTNDNMIGSLKISKKLASHEGAEIRGCKHATETGALVFNDTTGGGTTTPCNISIDPGEYYPDGAGAETPVYSEYQFEGGEIIYVADAAITVEKEAGIDYATAFANYYRRALFTFINNAGSAKAITKLQIHGDVTYKGNLLKSKVLLVADTEKLFTYDAAYLTALLDTDKLASGLARYFKYSDFRYELKSKTVYGLGAFADIEDSMLGIDNRCVVMGIEDINVQTGEYLYILEGIAEYTAEDVVNEGVFTPPPPPPPGSGPTVTDGTSPSYTEIQEGYTLGGGTKTPTVPTIAECRAIGLNAITLNWDRQHNLTNFDRYDVQVSADEIDWYALRNDGVDWKGTINEFTSVAVEYITHENIPPGGTEDAPTALMLYYKVRCVTKEPVASNYSTAASATTNLIESKYIKQDAITTAKLIDAAVQTAKMSVITREFINNISQTHVLNGWGGIHEDGSGSTSVMSLVDATVNGATTKVLRITFSGNIHVRSKTFPINHNKIYRFSVWIKKSSAESNLYLRMPAFDEINEGTEGADAGLGDKLVKKYNATTRAYISENTDTYFWSGDVPAIWTEYTSYIVGANRDVNDCPQHKECDVILQPKSDTTCVAINFRDYGGTSERIFDICSPSITEAGVGQIVADNIVAGAILAGHIAAGAIETAKLAALAVTAEKISANAVETLKLAAGAVTAEKMATTTLQAQFAAVAFKLTIGFAGTGTYDDPDNGDTHWYMDDDEIIGERYNGATWDQIIKLQPALNDAITLSTGRYIVFGGNHDYFRINHEGSGGDGIINCMEGDLYITRNDSQPKVYPHIVLANSNLNLEWCQHLLRRGQDSGTWIKVTNPDTGWIASETGFTGADSWLAGCRLLVDFTSLIESTVYAYAKAVRLVVYQTGTKSKIYYRKYADGNIADHPDASSEFSHLLMGSELAYAQVVVWLNPTYDAVEFTPTNTGTDLYISYPVEFLV